MLNKTKKLLLYNSMGKNLISDFIFALNKKDMHVCGIYCIINIVNNKSYIGSATNVYMRIQQHKSLLCRAKHYNNHLQSSFDKYGIVNFKASVLEKCNERDLAARELYWIQKYDSYNDAKGYNQCLVTELRKNVVSRRTKSQISKCLMGGKEIWMMDKKTENTICKFDSLYEAANYIVKEGITISSERNVRIKISEAARNKFVVTGNGRFSTRYSAYGFKWRII